MISIRGVRNRLHVVTRTRNGPPLLGNESGLRSMAYGSVSDSLQRCFRRVPRRVAAQHGLRDRMCSGPRRMATRDIVAGTSSNHSS